MKSWFKLVCLQKLGNAMGTQGCLQMTEIALCRVNFGGNCHDRSLGRLKTFNLGPRMSQNGQETEENQNMAIRHLLEWCINRELAFPKPAVLLPRRCH